MPSLPSTSLVISVSIESDGVMSRFTPNTAPTAANVPAIPASGCLPTDANAAAARGMRMR